MKLAQPIGPAQIEQSSEIDNTANNHELTRKCDAFRQDNNGADELSADDLDILLRRVSQASTREIDNLMGELRSLRNKLQIDGNRIQSDIAKYTQLSQGIMQLATIISDSVKKLPDAWGIAQKATK
jgi:hypothetical protein